MLKGHGLSTISEDTLPMDPEDICYIPQGAPHSFANASADEACEIVFIYGGAPNLEKAGYELVS